MDRLSNASVDGTLNLPQALPPTACNPSSVAGDCKKPDEESASSAVLRSPPPQLDRTVQSATAVPVPMSSPLHQPQQEQMPVPDADYCGTAALNRNSDSGAVVGNDRMKKAFFLDSGSAAPTGCTATSLHSGPSTVVIGVDGAMTVVTAVVVSSAQRLPLSPSRPLNCTGNSGHNRPINDVPHVSTGGPSSTPSAAAATCASTTLGSALGALTATRVSPELSRSWQNTVASVASASQALLQLVPPSASVGQTLTVSATRAPQAHAAARRPPMPATSVGSTVHRLPLPSLAVTVGNVPAATAQGRASSAAAAAVTAGPRAIAPAVAAPQKAARIAAANILKSAVDTGFAVTCLAHKAYRDALARDTGWSANQLLDLQQLRRKDDSNSGRKSSSSTTVAESASLSTAVDAITGSAIDNRLRLVWAVDENSRCVRRAALEVLASVLPQRHVCGYYSRFENTRCEFRTESQLVLERHRRTAHVDAVGRLACARCGFTVRSAGHFHQHCSASHGDDGVHEPPTKTFCCPVCTYETGHPNRAQKHVERCVRVFDETENLRPSEEALISSRVVARDCRPTVADVLAEVMTAAALSQTALSAPGVVHSQTAVAASSVVARSQTAVAASGVVHREVMVVPRPYVGIAGSQHQPSIVLRSTLGGTSVEIPVTDGQQLLLQRRGLAGTSLMTAPTPRALAAARPVPATCGSVVAQGDSRSAAAAAAAVVRQQQPVVRQQQPVAPQQPVVRLTARPAGLLPPGNSPATASGSTVTAIAKLQQPGAVAELGRQPVARLVLVSGRQVASVTGDQQQPQPAPSAAKQVVLRPPQLSTPGTARAAAHQVASLGRSGEPQPSWPVQLQRAPLRDAVVPSAQARLLPKQPGVTGQAENAKILRTISMPKPPPLRLTGRHQLPVPSISRPPALSSPLLATGGRPPAALLPTGRPTVSSSGKGSANLSPSFSLGQASVTQSHPAAVDAKAKLGSSLSPDVAISKRQLINCDICHSFLDKCDLPLHMARRHPDGLEHDVHIQCDQCSQRFAEVGPLVEHLLATHLRHDPTGPQPRQNSCFICLLPVDVESILIHIAVSHSKIIFKMFNARVCESPLCVRDRTMYANEQLLSTHVLEKHGMPTATLVPLVRAINRMMRLAELDPRYWERCEQCNLTFRLRGEFLEHLQHDHLRCPCRHCSVGYLTAESLQWHMLRCHGIGAPPRPCRICRLPVASDRLIDHCMSVHPQITRAYVPVMRIRGRQPATSEAVVATSSGAISVAPIETASRSGASNIVEAPKSVSSDLAVDDHCMTVRPQITRAYVPLIRIRGRQPATSEAVVATSSGVVSVDPIDTASRPIASVIVEAPKSVSSDLAVEALDPAGSDIVEVSQSSTSGVVVEAPESVMSHIVETLTSATSDVVAEFPASGTSVRTVDAPKSVIFDAAVAHAAPAMSDPGVEASASATPDVAIDALVPATSDVALEAPAFANSRVTVDAAASAMSDIVDVPNAVKADILEGTKPAMLFEAAESPTLVVFGRDLQHATGEELDEDVQPPAKKKKV